MNTKALRQKILDLAIHGKLVPPVCRQAGKTLTTNPKPRIEGGKCWFTYVIECEDGSFYKGYTDDLLRRYRQHCIGTGAQYTKVHKPKQLYYWEMHYSEEAALEREKYLKSGVGREWFKKEVVNKPDDFEPTSEQLRRINPKAEITSDNAQYGNVPNGWCLIKGKDLFQPMKSTKPHGDTFKYIDIDAIDNKSNSIKEIKNIEAAKAPSRASRYTQKNDIVFSMVRPYLRNIAMVKESGCIASTGFYICSPYSFMSPDFCYCLMLSDYVVNGLNTFMKGDNSPSINKGNVDEWVFPLPPLAEQRRIVSEIERWFSLIDVIESGKANLQAAVNQAKAKILDLAIHGKLVPPVCRQAGKTPSDEPASELLHRINPKAEITSDNAQYGKMPFEVPESWEWTTIGNIAKSNIGLTYKPTDVCNDGVPVYRSNNIRNGRIDTTELVRVNTKILEKQFLNTGDLLICARNGSRRLVGKCALIEELTEPTSFGAFMAVCRSAYNPWICLLLNTTYFDRYLDGSNSATINQVTQSMLLAFRIPLPPLAEQHRIVAKIEELFAQLDRIEVSI